MSVRPRRRYASRVGRALAALALVGVLATAGTIAAFAVSGDSHAALADTVTTVLTETAVVTTESGVGGKPDRALLWIFIGVLFWFLIFAVLIADVFGTYWWRNKLLTALTTGQPRDEQALGRLMGTPLWGIINLARSLLAFAVVGFLGLVLLYVLVERPTDQPKEIIETLITIIGTITAAVVAFYFGVRSGSGEESSITSLEGLARRLGAPDVSNTALPTITGAVSVGGTLQATPGTWTGDPKLKYQWEREVDGSWTPIAGATNRSYVLDPQDAGKKIRVVVTAENRLGQSTTAESAPTVAVTENGPEPPPGPAPPPTPTPEPPPSELTTETGVPQLSNTAPPTISGAASVGETLEATEGTWTGDPTPPYEYRWELEVDGSWTPIAGASNRSYVLDPQDAGKKIRVVVIAKKPPGEPIEAASEPTVVATSNGETG